MENIIDLSTSFRELSGNSKTNPICLGLQGDMESYTVPFKFTNANIVNGCKCFVQYINANQTEGKQEINNNHSKQIDDSGTINVPDDKNIEINWKPNNILMEQKGLITFSFQFYKINDNNVYSFILNTSPIYGYVHNGLVIDEEMISEQYPSQIAELYDKYNKLIKDDEDLEDLESLTDIKLYLNNRVPKSIDVNIDEEELPDGYQYLVAYDPKTERYSYTPAIKLKKEFIIGNIWNAE